MINLHIERESVNPDALHAQLKAALGESCPGLSVGGGVVTIHLADETTAQQQAEARAIVAAHDPAVLTPAQQTARDRDALPLFRLAPDEAVAWAAAQDAAAFLREMARAFALLRDLVRGG